MKKLILILITGLFLSNTSYGATIKELLKGKKSIRLSCLINYYAYSDIEDPLRASEEKPDWIGHKIFIVIQDKLFSTSGHDGEIEYHLDETTDWSTGDPIERKILISDEFIKLKHLYNLISVNDYVKSRDYEKVDIKINRFTGAFVWNERHWTSYSDIQIRGDCTKVEEQIF